MEPVETAACTNQPDASEAVAQRAGGRAVAPTGRAGSWLALRVGPLLISGAVWLLTLTWRIDLSNGEELFARWARGEQVIVAFWHNRILLMPVAARGQRICIMNSQHRDGEIATRAIARWGIHSVRGSATRGGVRGFLQLVRAFRQGYSLAVVPDGPRGPREVAKPGVIHLARATGSVIIPVSYAASGVRRLRSWDRLMIPLPFARVRLVVGEALSVPREAGADELERCREVLEQRLNDLSREAESAFQA